MKFEVSSSELYIECCWVEIVDAYNYHLNKIDNNSTQMISSQYLMFYKQIYFESWSKRYQASR
jgi:hypothetical protein